MTQRNAALRGLGGAAPDDIVVISDCDEIPRASAMRELSEMLDLQGDVVALEMASYYYALNLRGPETWRVARATRRSTLDLITPQELRTMFTVNRIPAAGWHFSYLAPTMERVSKIARKAEAFAHGELDLPRLTNDEYLRDALANDELWWRGSGQALLHRVPIDETFPQAVRADPRRWQDYVVEGAGDRRYEYKYRWEKLKRDLRKGRRLLRTSTQTSK
jgi:beta-1,4-mannosyl-glycoprotein beta-1,4-N-acetylglucosaminyltransferase